MDNNSGNKMSSKKGWNIATGEGIRRLPVYLLLDTSGSMSGAPIESVRRAVDQCVKEIQDDPQTQETAYFGIITFGGEARFVTKGLVPATSFLPPVIDAEGQTPFGQALWLLVESIDKDIKKAVIGGEKGDWKPMVYILTDGQPTDDWKPALDMVKKKASLIIAVGCGPSINREIMKTISESSFEMGNDDASFQKFFKWVTQSVKAVSKSVSQPGGETGNKMLPPPPPGIQYIP
jgi:uncharacterized protein YegL